MGCGIPQEVRHREHIRRFDGQAFFLAVADLPHPVDDQLLDRTILILHTDLLEPLEETEGRTVEDRDLAMNLDQQVRDSARMEGGQEVFDGLDVLTLAGDGRGVVGLRHGADMGRNHVARG